MSNPTTYYTVGGVDLSSIFQPSSGPPYLSPTGYTIPGGQDLSEIFAMYGGGSEAPPTGYNFNLNGTPTDLSQVFAPYNPNPAPFSVTGGTYTYSTGNNYGIIFLTSGTGASITFTDTVNNASVYTVGGGGGGGGGQQFTSNNRDVNSQIGGGGGGSGMIVTMSGINSFSANDSFIFTIGEGGAAGGGGCTDQLVEEMEVLQFFLIPHSLLTVMEDMEVVVVVQVEAVG